MYGWPADLCAATAPAIFTICTKARVPSCILVPPEVGEATSGSPSSVARSTAVTIRSAAATPTEPARNPNSHAMIAMRRPRNSPSPVSTDSSVPAAALARASADR
jgi:hypothetical protein